MPGPTIRSARRHAFAVTVDDLWAALVRVEDYRRWWPWLVALDADGFETGARWRCAVRPPLGYTLAFDLRLDRVVERRSADATISGDLTGHASLEVRAVGGASELVLTSDLTASGLVIRTLATVARPLAVRGHDAILDTGLSQFEARALRER